MTSDFKMRKYSEKNRIIFFAPSAAQPRLIKRATQLSKLCTILIIHFQRKYYRINSYDDLLDRVDLGLVTDRKYYRRLFLWVKAFYTIILKTRKSDIFYVCSLDCLILTFLSRKNISYYEIGDLRTIEKPWSLTARLERLIMKFVNKIVITSWSFYEDYYKHYGFDASKFILIENRISEKTYKAFISPRPNEKNRIGVIGFLRYRRPLEYLLRYATENENSIELVIFGDGPHQDLFINTTMSNVKYCGPFKAPDDLPKIYAEIDYNYIVYENQSENVKLALPNKLFESLASRTPIIAAENTALSNKVSDLGVGFSVGLGSYFEFKETMDQMLCSTITRFQSNLLQVREDEFLDRSDELLAAEICSHKYEKSIK